MIRKPRKPRPFRLVNAFGDKAIFAQVGEDDGVTIKCHIGAAESQRLRAWLCKFEKWYLLNEQYEEAKYDG